MGALTPYAAGRDTTKLRTQPREGSEVLVVISH